ncbi:helix-turn-helix domain-containing protein [Cohnella sp.]|uniref:helix-turn-helix domain-containing protein n=1 Tax=Cohnella sp. TaxID=1883426 RepID=UPI003561CF58
MNIAILEKALDSVVDEAVSEIANQARSLNEALELTRKMIWINSNPALIGLVQTQVIFRLGEEFRPKPKLVEPEPEIMTFDVEDIAKRLKISKETVKKRLRNGEIEGYRQGHHWRVHRDKLLDYERRLMGASG